MVDSLYETFVMMQKFKKPVLNTLISKDEKWKYKINDDGLSVTVTDCLVLDSDVVVPTEICGLPVTDLGERLFYYNPYIRSVRIPKSVRSIRKSAFEGCHDLNSIEIPNGVFQIEDCAFSFCVNLKTVILPDSLVNVGFGAFYYCKNITCVTIGSGLRILGDYMFYNDDNIKELYFNGDILFITKNAFSEKAIENATIYFCREDVYLPINSYFMNDFSNYNVCFSPR